MMKMVRLIALMFAFLLCAVHASKKSKMTQAGKEWLHASTIHPLYIACIVSELNTCIEKTKDLNTACDFVKCFHERYHCNEDSATAWAYELCLQFPTEVVIQFTPQVKIDRATSWTIRCSAYHSGTRYDDRCSELYARVPSSDISSTEIHQL